MLTLRNWAVCGDVLNPAKAASSVVSTLQGGGKTVYLIDPRSPAGSGPGTFQDLKGIGGGVEALNLCINPKLGLGLIKQAKEMGVRHVFVQPGAGSKEIEDFAKDNRMAYRTGCVIVEMTGSHFNSHL